MALIGTVDPYVPNTSFSNYFEYFLSANAFAEEKKKDLFMELCGMAAFNEFKLLYPATDLKTLSYTRNNEKTEGEV